MNRMRPNKVKDDKRTPDIIYDKVSVFMGKVSLNNMNCILRLRCMSIFIMMFTLLMVQGLFIPQNVEATTETYYEKLDNGTSYGSFTTDAGTATCTLTWTDPNSSGYKTLLSTNSGDLCGTSYRYTNTPGGTYSEAVASAYGSATTVTGTTYTITTRYSGTHSVQLFALNSSGSEVETATATTFSHCDSDDTRCTQSVDISSQSVSVPASGHLGVRITVPTGARVYVGDDYQTGGVSGGTLTVEESAGGGSGIAMRGASAQVNADSGNITVDKPFGTIENDIMIMAVTTYDSVSVSLPAGWTKFNERNNGSTLRSTVAWKRAGASEPANYTITHSSGSSIVAGISAFSGVITTGDPIDTSASQANGSSSTVTAPSITTTVDNALVIFTSHHMDNQTHSSWSATDPSSFTEAFDYNYNSTFDVSVALAYATRLSAGSTGNGTTTISGAIQNNGVLFALKPQAGAGGISIRGASAQVNANSGNITVDKPSGTVENDVMIMAVTTYDNVSVSLPAGWTKFNELNNGSTLRSTAAWKRAGASEPANYTITHSSGSSIVAGIASFSGVITTGSPIDTSASQANSSSLTVTAPSITTTVDNGLVIFTSHLMDNQTHSSWSATDPSSFTEAFDYDYNSTNAVTAALAYATRSSAGSTGSGTATLSGSIQNNGVLFALKPQPACTDPDPSTITISAGQSASGDPYDANTLISTTGDVGSFEYKVTGTTGSTTSRDLVIDVGSTSISTSGYTADWGICGGNPTVNATTFLKDATSIACADDKWGSLSATKTLLTVSNVKYTQATLVEGKTTSFNKFYIRDGGTYTFQLGYVSENSGTFTSFGGTAGTVTYSSDQTYNPDFSGMSGTAPADSFLALNITLTSGTGRIYIGTGRDATGSGEFQVNETVNVETTCTDWTSTSAVPATTSGGSACGDYSDSGTYTLYARGTDPDCSDAVTSSPASRDFTWTADVTAPTAGTVTPASTDYNSQYVDSPFNLSAAFTDNESAVTSCEYTTNGSTWNAADVSGSGPYTCTKTGATASDGASLTLNMRATSGGGTTTASSVSRTADAAAPATTDDYPGGTVTSNPTVILSPTDAGSGVASTLYCVDQADSCSPSTSGTSVSVTGTPGVLSVWYVRYYSTDNVGNAESVSSTTVTIDHTCSPAVSITGFNPTQGVAGSTSVTIDGSGFGASQGTGSVKFFNNQTSSITSWSDTQIVATAPAGAATGAITVQSDATCSDTSGSNFGVCTRSDPGITFIPSSGSIKAGQNQAYTVRISNNDQYCADSNFSYSLGSETGDTGSFTLSSTFTDGSTGALASGGTYDTALTVTADAGATVGHQLNTTINIAADGNHSAVSNSVTTTIIPTWSDNSNLLHNANRFGDCTNDAYDGTSQTDCEGAGGTWTATSKWSGNWGLGSGKYGGITCETCHADATTNIKKIKTSMTAPDSADSFPGQTGGKTISFLNPSTDFGDPASNSWDVCEYCHSTTSYHKYNQSAAHNGQVDCTDCHTHKSGFVGSGDCISCHSSAQGSGGYRRQVAGAGGDIDSGKTFHHVSYSTLDVATCEVCHDQASHKSNTDPGVLLNDPDGGAAITYTGVASELTNFCLNCHDGDNETPFTDSGDSTNMSASNLNIETSWTATYNHSANAECVDCHGDSGGDGSTTAPYLNGHGGDNALYLQGAGADTRAQIYSTCITGSCHGAGGSATVDMTVELSGTGGKHPIDGVVTPKSNIIANSMMVNGMTVSSTVTCSDCHGMTGGSPKGPHGGSWQYILKGVDTGIVSGGSPTNSDINNVTTKSIVERNFCINCHDASVYSLGSSEAIKTDLYVPDRANLSALLHYSDFREKCGATDIDPQNVGAKSEIGCTNCHAGFGRNYGAHSSSYGTADSAGVWTAQGGGFMNGDSWTQAPDSGGSCYATASATSWTSCNKGTHD